MNRAGRIGEAGSNWFEGDMQVGAHGQGLMDSARHVIKRILKPRFLSQLASYNVASTVHQSLPSSNAC